MSDNWLHFVPSDPEYQPSPEAAERARVLLAAFTLQADTVSVEFKESVKFFHPGSNWSGVECFACGADAESWWNSAMESAYEMDSVVCKLQLPVVTLACRSTTFGIPGRLRLVDLCSKL